MITKNTVSKVITQAPKRVGIAQIESGLDLLWAQFNQAISEKMGFE